MPYAPFPSFSEWKKQSAALSALNDVRRIVDPLRSKPEPIRRRVLETVRNITALETGAIEDLYPSDRGLTITAATGVSILEAVTKSHGETVRAYVAAALDAYEFVLDFSTRKQPIAAAWIRELHAEICKNQNTHRVLVGDIWEDRPLRKGEYKQDPNHVRLLNDEVHYYADPADTVAEMGRLVEELSSDVFNTAHPAEQASYAHYALVAVHPFADGNGRVARAFASIFTYRAYSVPLLIYANQKQEYFAALEEADNGSYVRFKNFIIASTLRAVRLLRDSYASAELRAPEDAFRDAAQMYETSGGYLQPEVDQGAIRLIDMIQSAMQKLIAELASDQSVPPERKEALALTSTISSGNWQATRDDHRRTIDAYSNRTVIISGTSRPPADAASHILIGISLPMDARPEDVFVLDTSPAGETAEIGVGDVMRGDLLEAEMLISIFTKRVFTRMLEILVQGGQASLRKKGFATR